jgi:BolA family transcriptional regulator, general stress-responsive regulator
LNETREQKIRAAINARLSPAKVEIKDQSHLHAGHAGAKEGKGHFDLVIISDRFTGISNLQRHRIVYDALAELMQSDIHAVSIKALTTAEE